MQNTAVVIVIAGITKAFLHLGLVVSFIVLFSPDLIKPPDRPSWERPEISQTQMSAALRTNEAFAGICAAAFCCFFAGFLATRGSSVAIGAGVVLVALFPMMIMHLSLPESLRRIVGGLEIPFFLGLLMVQMLIGMGAARWGAAVGTDYLEREVAWRLRREKSEDEPSPAPSTKKAEPSPYDDVF